MEGTRILIVEDEPLIAADLAAMLEDLGHRVCGKAHDADSALVAVSAERPDLVLLDIQLGPGADGVQVGGALGRLGIPFLYITSHTDAATMARVANTKPQGFIIKPFDEEDLRTQITVALARLYGDAGAGLLVRDRGRLVKVAAGEVIYAEADDNYTTLHTATRKYVLVSSLSAVAERLANPDLVRVHRKYIVNLGSITAMEGNRLHLGDVAIPIGRTHREEVARRWRQGMA